MDQKEEAAGVNRGSWRYPDGGHRVSRLPSPPQPCSCHDHCDGDYGGPHCNADIGGDIDALIAATRANASTATYLDVHRDGMARDVDGDPDRNGSARSDSHCCGDSGDCADTDCGGARARNRTPERK